MLRPKKHITRQKIKEDKFVTETLKAVNWLKKNQRKITAGAVIAALGLLVLWGAVSARRAGERESSLLTLQGGYLLEAGNLMEARTLLLQAAEEYGNVPSAGRATFMLGQVYFRLGSIDSSRIYYMRYLKEFGRNSMMKAAATAGLAACLDQQENYLAAAEEYESAAREYSDHPQTASYLLQAGRCYRLAGQRDRAITVYEQIMQKYPDSAESDRASIEMAQLAFDGGS